MDLKIVGLILDAAGSVLIGFAALRVHHRFLHEHKVDQKVFKTMRTEQTLGVLGILFVIAGLLVQLVAYA